MKKVCAVSAILLFVLPFCFAQNFLPKGRYRSPFENGMNGMTAISKSGGIRGQRFLTPIIGYENYVVPGNSNANAFLLGLDFMYRRNSGFTVWFNNALILGNASYTTHGYYVYSRRRFRVRLDRRVPFRIFENGRKASIRFRSGTANGIRNRRYTFS